VEEEEGLTMTPFEKNLEVWRQLWRVLERSDVVVQVVDARDPLFYRSEDLESYARCAVCESRLCRLADVLWVSNQTKSLPMLAGGRHEG
jgi:hypothetical protein